MRLRWLTIHAAELKAGARMAPNESSWSWRRIFWGRDLWRKALVALELGPMPLQKVWRRRSCCTGKRAFQAFRTLSLTWPVWWARGHHPSCSHYKQTQPSLPPSLPRPFGCGFMCASFFPFSLRVWSLSHNPPFGLLHVAFGGRWGRWALNGYFSDEPHFS